MGDTKGKVITCRAAVVWEPHKLSVETIEVAPPKKGEVRIKILYTSVCHTDGIYLDGNPLFSERNPYPAVLGHEGAGIVESVGEGVTSVAPGDHVIPLYAAECRECDICKHPRANFPCEKIALHQVSCTMMDGTTRLTCKGKPLYQFFSTSTFSEYTVVPEIAVCKINPKAPLDKACLLGCGIPTGMGTALNIAQVHPGSTCAVWGLGAIGLACVLGCKLAGAKRIIGIDINPGKFNDTAKKMGCTEFVNPKDHKDPIENVIQGLTGGGADYTFECVGSLATIKAAFMSSRPAWGISVAVGATPFGEEVSFLPVTLLFGRQWRGSAFGGYKGLSSVPKLVEEYLAGKLPLDDFVSQRLPLTKINDAFKSLKTGNGFRTVVDMSQ